MHPATCRSGGGHPAPMLGTQVTLILCTSDLDEYGVTSGSVLLMSIQLRVVATGRY